MKRFVSMLLITLVLLLIVNFNIEGSISATPGEVDKQGLTVTTQSEYVIAGYLKFLNKKYKLRLTETLFKPGGYLGEHHHAGPGIRVIKSGVLTSIHAKETKVYKPGESFFEAGNEMHALQNRTNAPAQILNFEILPVDWKGASAIPIPATGETSKAAPVSAMPVHSEAHP